MLKQVIKEAAENSRRRIRASYDSQDSVRNNLRVRRWFFLDPILVNLLRIILNMLRLYDSMEGLPTR